MPKLIYEIIESYGKGRKAVQRRPDSIWYRFMRMDGCFHSSCLRCGTDAQMSSADLLKTGQDSSLLALDAVRDAVGPGFPIEARISGDDMTDKGLGLELSVAG